MAVDTFVAYVGVYPTVEDAEADYQLVKDLHTKAGMMDAYDAAVIEKRADGKGADHQEARDADAGWRSARRRCWSGYGLVLACFRSPQSWLAGRDHGRWGRARCGERTRGGWDESQRSQGAWRVPR